MCKEGANAPCTGVAVAVSVSAAPPFDRIPASSPDSLVTCNFCGDDELTTQLAITCPVGSHHYCNECFGNHVNTHVATKEFVANDCAIYCSECKERNVSSNFNMQELASR